MLFKVTLVVIHFLKLFSFKFFGILDDISKLLGHFTLKNNQIGQKSEGKILLPMLVMIWKPSRYYTAGQKIKKTPGKKTREIK